jgi:hypothetical protein
MSSEPDDPRTGVAAANFGGWLFAILIALMLLKMLGS